MGLLFAIPSGKAHASAASFGRGVYAAPAANGVAGAAAFDQSLGTLSTEVLDFAPTNSWAYIEGPSWLLQPHSGQRARLEYSLPVVPSIAGARLSQCASGAYNVHWANLARNLVRYQLANTVIRPGWEMNGNWYRWSAATDPTGYFACFRNVVTAMRQVPGQHFLFDWNVNNNKMSIAAELAYPGDAYVDIIGDDVYDTSWTWYAPGKVPSADDQRRAILYQFGGDHGLNFWAAFARTHGKKLALTEWGLAHRSDGRGGQDNPQYVQAMYNFMANPSNNVVYEHYFNTSTHVLTGATAFPKSASLFRSLF